MSYILSALPDNQNPNCDGYYTGKSYIYQGSCYAVVEGNIEQARRYSTKGRAESACKKINDKFENYRFGVEEDNRNV